ncbi:uncharacterized protein LOC122035154 [Zingiber officinale]|uniref:RING-CH-type domain-containing protein n=1 Tax=Zingiber officinale TaxID=94328 RepID=A0A8J5BBT6_ZINOF|nr:uncharacterized protein LOC122035154 [Zingiber officinale]KAG6468594.1 hypothetical protein ZIOFF_073282 [Zingiber officinale]
MGDHFVILVDRLLTESTLGAAIESINQGGSNTKIASLSVANEVDSTPNKKINANGTFDGKLVECRICQDEDEDTNMEIPCSCCGSLKYAHRKCVQKWCNEKGDTKCEICLQQFKPGYTAPPKLFLYGTSPMNFRGNWEISRQDIQSHQYIAMTQTNRVYLRPNYNDYATSHDRSIMYCRIVAASFMVVLILRHSIPFMISGTEQYSIPFFTLLLLRIVGIVLPLYIILRAITTFYQRRQLHEMNETSVSVSQTENEQLHSLQVMQTRPYLVRVH